jgi:RND family efflux transporter MFP subunit
MLRLDPRDHELAVRQRESALARARAALQLEQGNQSIARQEFEVLGESIRDEDRDLVLRKPQLDSALAEVAAAEAALGEARLALARATLRAPFDALVRTRSVELGARVAPGTPVAILVDTSAYWVELSLPVSQLRFVSLPAAGAPGSPVKVFDPSAWGPGASRAGRVIRLLGDIEPEGRMARVLVEIPDPLALRPENAGKPALLVGSYVRGEIEGTALEGVVSLDRALLRDGDRVWVMNAKGELEIRPVEVAFRGSEHVLVSSGLAPGERIVVSELSAPVEGMPLRTAEDEPAPEPAR